MKKIVVSLIVTVFLGLNSFAQNVTSDDVIGGWVAKNIPNGGPSFELNFHEQNMVSLNINGRLSRQRYDIDSVANLVKIQIKTDKGERSDTMLILIKYVDSKHLKAQISRTPKMQRKWNNKETTANTGQFIKRT